MTTTPTQGSTTTSTQGSTTAHDTMTGRQRTSGHLMGARTTSYGRHIAGVLGAAFTLSAGHTVYAWVEGIEDPTFTVTTPLAWGFYVVAFGSVVLAGRTGRTAQLLLLAFLMALLGIAIFYYPTTFGPAQQTTFGWFENDVYVGLLVTATYLAVQRLRRTTLTPA